MNTSIIKKLIVHKNGKELTELLNSGWDPNFEGGWPIRLAARYGCFSMVELLIGHGANPHLLSESGASTLQLAVYSGEHWETDCWTFLLSCCDSSQLADGAAVAIIFDNKAALKKILDTGRCNSHIPTTLTGKTLEQLAKGYKMAHFLNIAVTGAYSPSTQEINPSSPNNRTARPNRSEVRHSLSAHQSQRNLSPSVARFFQQTAGQSSLTPPRRPTLDSSSPTNYFN